MSGYSLSKFIKENHSNELRPENVFTLGLQIIDALEIIHDAGYVYNCISPDKIFLG